jgi:Ig-like domain CHU_C associated
VITKSKPVALTFAYDAAERLTSLSEAAGPVKEYEFDAANALGRMAAAIRHNRTALGTIAVREEFSYDAGGRVSAKKTIVGSAGTFSGASFQDTYSYDALGQPTGTGYPNVLPPFTCAGCVARTVTTSYEHGYVSAVGPYTFATTTTPGITYHPNGLVASLRHKNTDGSAGPVYTQTLANGMARPGEIKVDQFCGDLAILAHPQSQTIAAGQSVTLSVTAVEASSYEWFEGSSETPIAGQVTSTLTVSPAATTTYRVRARRSGCYRDSMPATVTVQNCTPPDATISAPASAAAGGTVTASVPDTGSTYAWSIQNGTILAGAGTRSITFTAFCTGATVTVSVTVAKSGCDSTSSKPIAISKSAVAVSGSTTIPQGGSATIQATFTGVGPWSGTWSDGVPYNQSQTTMARTVSPAATTTYTIASLTDGNGCSGTIAGQAVITVTPPAPVVSARAEANDRIRIDWTFSGTADAFQVVQDDVVIFTTGSGDVRSHSAVVASGSAHVYKVRAIRSGASSGDSNRDLATAILFADDPIVAGGPDVAAQHIVQLRTAVQAVRQLAGLGLFSFEDPTLTPAGTLIRTVHINQLRLALDQARAALALPALTYLRNPVTTSHDVDDVDFMEVRGGVR